MKMSHRITVLALALSLGLSAAANACFFCQRSANINNQSSTKVQILSSILFEKDDGAQVIGTVALANPMISATLGHIAYKVSDASGQVVEEGTAALVPATLINHAQARFAANLSHMPASDSTISIVYED
jgi:hypothetical protein